MKIHRHSQSGSSLLISMAMAIVIGIFLAGYLRMAGTQVTLSQRSAVWNLVIAIAEAGIEEGFTHLHAQGVNNLNSNGWSADGASYIKTTQLSDGSYYNMRISTGASPTITSEGFAPAPKGEGYISRVIQVTTQSDSLYVKALVAKGYIDMNGNNVTTDSFDSSDPAYSTGGKYDPTRIKDNGDVATNLDLIDSIDIGNANIKGRVSTGPGGTIRVGSNGAVGDLAWHNSGHNGIKDGWSSDDMNVSFPDVEVPFSGGAWTPASGSVGGTNYTYVLNGGNYQMSSLSIGSKNKMLITGRAVLYVTGNVSVGGQAEIVIAPGASLDLYVGGSSTDLGGNGVINYGDAKDFFYFGLPNNTSITFGGNGEFTGVIYAPQADVAMNGGGSGSNDFIGAGIFNSIRMNGHFNFHYDEFLGTLDNSRGFIITGWNEVAAAYTAPSSDYD